MRDPETPERPLRTSQVAALLDVDARTIRRWAMDGVLPAAIRLPHGERRFHRQDVLNLCPQATPAS